MNMTIKYMYSSPSVYKFMEKGKLHPYIYRSNILPNLIIKILFSFCCKASWFNDNCEVFGL